MSQPPNSRSSSLASGTKSLISGVRPSVRLPSRTVASCVSDPIGAPRPRLTASTPAINVVLTAPMPGSSTPSLPSAGAIETGPFVVKLENSLASALSKSRRKFGAEGLIGMQHASAFDQHLFGLGNVGIRDAAIDRAYRRALFLVEKADAFGALVGDDVIDVLLDRGLVGAVEFPLRAAFINRGVGALGLARTAVDAFFCNQRRHFPAPSTVADSTKRPNGNNIGARQEEQVFQGAARSVGDGVCDASRELEKRDARRMHRVRDDNRHAVVAGLAHVGIDRDPRE